MSATKTPSAPKEPRPDTNAKREPAQAASDHEFIPLTGLALAEALHREEVVLRVVCRSIDTTLAVLRAVGDDGDVMVAKG